MSTAAAGGSPAAIDPVTLGIVNNGFVNVCREMGITMIRTAFSPIFNEGLDFSCVLFDKRGNMIGQAEFCPAQIAASLFIVRWTLEELGIDSFEPGDVVLHNDPYRGGAHIPEHSVIRPVFHEGELFGFVANVGHLAEIGGKAVGSFAADATEVFQEGLRIPPIKIVKRDVNDMELWRLIMANHRTPRNTWGDLNAQIGSLRVAERRVIEMLDRYGRDFIDQAANELMDYSERLLRREIELLPDGTYSAEGFLDGFVDHPDPAYKNLRSCVAVTIAGSDMTVDLTGSAPQIELPLNMPLEGTVDIAIYLTIRSILLDTARRDAVPANSGLFRPITIIAPEGSIANPRFPAPTIARACPGNIIADTLMRALAQVVPDRVSAGVGNLRVAAFSGLDAGRHWVYMDIHEGSYGGRPGKDGLDAVDTLYANTRNNPIEDIESHYPLRVTRYELNEGSGGRGRWRGGLGSIREIELLADGGFSLEGEGCVHAPPGLFGGGDGTPGSVVLISGDGSEQELPSKFPYRKARRGDRLRLVGPSGGGYEPAELRDAQALRDDDLDGYTGTKGS